MINFFRDLFTAEALIGAIEKADFIPSMTRELFKTEPLTGTKLLIEEDPANPGELIVATPRGTPSKAATFVRRKVHSFETSHYRKDGAVYADEVLNARAYGMSAALDTVASRRDRLIAKLRRDIDLTHEALRISCINSPTNSLGTAPASTVVAFGASDTTIRSAVFDNVIVALETALGGIPFTGAMAICHDTFWKGLLESKTINSTYLNQAAASELRGSTLTNFEYGGITWVRYRGHSNANITAGKAKVIPLGVPDLFIQAFAPADTFDQVGAGLSGGPYFANSYPIDNGNRGWYVEIQTNPVMICTRPEAVLTLGLT